MQGLLEVARRKAGSWSRTPWVERAWFFAALPLLGVSRVLLWTLPFNRMAPYLGRDMRSTLLVPLATERQASRAAHVGRGIRMAARYTPWDSRCLAQAMVARMLLGVCRLPYAVYLGVNRTDEGGLIAHAWVHSGRVAVTGGDGFSRFSTVGAFVSSRVLRDGLSGPSS